jgi:hypothetical protein
MPPPVTQMPSAPAPTLAPAPGTAANTMPPLHQHGAPPLPHPAAMNQGLPVSHGAPVHEEMHRRLAEAFNIPAPPLPQQHHQSPNKPQAEAPRESWASGNVTIEEGFTPFAHQAARQPNPYTAPAISSAETPQPPRSFEPAPPADIRRHPRRMPAAEDLPVQAQKEWQARQGGTSQPPPPSEEGRKKGLFDRITGLGRRPDARAADDHTTDGTQEEAKLPVFFGRERR